jgi:hypothetical protein
MVRARTCRLELNQIWRKFRNDPGADRQGHEIGTMQYPQCPAGSRFCRASARPELSIGLRFWRGFSKGNNGTALEA